MLVSRKLPVSLQCLCHQHAASMQVKTVLLSSPKSAEIPKIEQFLACGSDLVNDQSAGTLLNK